MSIPKSLRLRNRQTGLSGLKRRSAQWLRPELRVRVKHLKAKGVLRHATVKQFITA